MPPEQRVQGYLRRARRRGMALGGLALFAVAAILCAVPIALLRIAGASPSWSVGLIAAAVAIAVIIMARPLRSAGTATAIEKRAPAFRNTLITAAELLRHPDLAKPHIREIVFNDTAQRIDQVTLGDAVPAGRIVMVSAALLAAAGASLAFALSAPPVATSRPAGTAAPGAPSIRAIEAIVTPPAYTGRPLARFGNPERLSIVEGSHVALRVDANVDRIDAFIGERTLPLTRGAAGMFTAGFGVGAEAFISLAPFAGGRDAGRHLIPLDVTPDRSPSIRVEAPGRDLMLADAARDIPVRITAQDDFGLTSLTLAYTKVSGSGETFEFVEGTLPLTIARSGATELRGRAVIRPSALGLAPGDMLVYRGVARDSHPSRGVVESDAFVIEIVTASEAMAEGFSIDDQRDKYALSQQMVILKTEKLVAARRGMTAQAATEEAALIAAEQRRVRAEFVFMMGGEVEDEEVEAEHSHEIEEGREQNRGRRDLLTAIRSMSDAAALLLRPDVDQALAAEKRALVSLQRAFTRSRYILRVLSTRERIDDTRRLSGDRAGLGTWRRERPDAGASAAVQALRAALADLSLLARRDGYGPAESAALTTIAEALLRAAPGHT
ncbi:MAG: DUF4175 domain-containing protein, partial [Acidobacteriota bacterium]|nr:DUF4175 domain-containing protein [Acidobacteriota bacterium]